METWYRVQKWNIEIKAVRVTKATKNSIWIDLGNDYRGRPTKPRRSLINTQYDQYFSTWEQAHAYLVKRSEQKVSYYERELAQVRLDLKVVSEMQPPH